jgi:hypothetical protein
MEYFTPSFAAQFVQVGHYIHHVVVAAPSFGMLAAADKKGQPQSLSPAAAAAAAAPAAAVCGG